jgi:hypothetical protein
MILKKQPGVGKYSLLAKKAGVLMLLLSVFNLLKSFEESLQLLDVIYLIIPFFVISGLFFTINNKAYVYITILAGGLYAAIDQPNSVDFSGASMFFMLYGIDRNKKHGLVLIIITLLSISLRVLFFDLGFFAGMKLILAYTVVYDFSRTIFASEKVFTIDIELKSIDKKILKRYSNGQSYEQIIREMKLGIEPDSLRKRITNIRKLSGCNNDVQFGKYISDIG